MDKKLKAKWIKALRSGRYQQTQNALKEGNGYCCLGVLLSVSRAGRWLDYGTYRVSGTLDCDGELGKTMLKRFGITDAQENKLISMNDTQGKDFDAIADYVERKL